MLFEEITRVDLDELKELQPEGWSDISKYFKQYIERDFCYPIKVVIGGEIVGLGNAIVFDKTGWLAHVIVKKECRNRGVGVELVKFLVSELKKKHVESFLLIATELGEPVYKKVGFRTITDYLFFKREQRGDSNIFISDNIIPYRDQLYDEVIQFDKLISGENREPLLKLHMKDALVYQDKDKIHGMCFPDLGEGLIIADTPDAGLALMNLRGLKNDKAVIPADNEVALNFLLQNGFKQLDTKARRMMLGKDIAWKSDDYYSRIGGNLG